MSKRRSYHTTSEQISSSETVSLTCSRPRGREYTRGYFPSVQLGGVLTVPDPGKGVCADPVNGGAILGKGGSDPQGGNKERQLSPDKGRDKT